MRRPSTWVTAAACWALGMGAPRAEPRFDAPLRSYPAGVEPRDVLIRDFDLDGRLDAAVLAPSEEKVHILRGQGDGTFAVGGSYPAYPYPEALLSADVLEDGFPELLVACPWSYVNVLVNQRGTNFSLRLYPLQNSPEAGFAAGDFDGDGHVDVLGLDEPGRGLLLGRGRGDGTLREALRQSLPGFVWVSDIATADLNGDGRLDLVLSGRGTVYRLLGNGNGTFGFAVPIATDGFSAPVVIADVNADGVPDLAVGSTGAVLVVLGDGTGGFGPPHAFGPAASSPSAVAAADLDADGVLDLVAAERTLGTVYTLRGRGDGAFEPGGQFASGSGARDLEAADLDGDDAADLVLVHQTGDRVAVLHNNGDGSFGHTRPLPAGADPRSLVAADLNGDGLLDLAATNPDRATVTVRLGTGGGDFADSLVTRVGGEPVAIAFGDLDGDEFPDLVAASRRDGALLVLRGTGGGRYAEPVAHACGERPSALVLADLNGDGAADAVVANGSLAGQTLHLVTVRLGRADGTFERPVGYETRADPAALGLGDVNGDGTPDLAVACAGADVVSLLLGNGDGTFRGAGDLDTGPVPRSVVCTDLDRDGAADLVTGHDTGASVHWGRGSGAFETRRTLFSGGGVDALAVADLDHDAELDLVLAQAALHALVVLAGAGGRTFSRTPDLGLGAPMSVAIADFDADGLMDLAVGYRDYSMIWVLQNRSHVVPIAVQDLEASVLDGRVVLRWRLGSGLSGAVQRVVVERGPRLEGPWQDRVSLRPAASMSFAEDLDASATWYRLRLELAAGGTGFAAPVHVAAGPWRTVLHAPIETASGTVRIGFSIAGPAPVRLAVFDVRGRRLWSCLPSAPEPGEHVLAWDRKDDHGGRLVRGVYVLVLETLGARWTRKLPLLGP